MFGDIPLISQQEFVNISNSIIKDPLTSRPMRDPVALVPCGDSVDRETAQKLFGVVDNYGKLEHSGHCPKCKNWVVDYIPNHGMSHILKFINQRLQASAARALPMGTPIARESNPVIPYPGKEGRFICITSWNVPFRPIPAADPNNPVCRIMQLSRKGDSFISSVNIFGHKDGSIVIEIDCDHTQRKVFGNYMYNLGLLKDSELNSFDCKFIATRPHEIDWAFDFLAGNNALPEKEFKIFQRLYEAKNWKFVEEDMRCEAATAEWEEREKRKSRSSSSSSTSVEAGQKERNESIFYPCGHSAREITARNLFGTIQFPGMPVLFPKPCSTCKMNITSYLPNHSMRTIPNIFELIQARAAIIPPPPPSPQETPLMTLPFPGVRANFECVSPPWNEQADNPNAPLQRSMHFKSTTPSFLAGVDVFGYGDGHISIRVTASKAQKDAFEKYLESVGITLDWSTFMSGSFTATTPQHLKWTLQFLSENNTFPEADLAFIRRLAEAKNWRLLKDIMKDIPSCRSSSSSVSMPVRESSHLESKACPPPATMNAQEAAHPVYPMSDDEERPHLMYDDVD